LNKIAESTPEDIYVRFIILACMMTSEQKAHELITEVFNEKIKITPKEIN
jgi:hypothetical protein